MAISQAEILQFNVLEEILTYLGVSRSTYFRLKKQGKVKEERVYKDERMVYNIYVNEYIHLQTSKTPVVKQAIQRESSMLGLPRLNPKDKEPYPEESVNHEQYLQEWIHWREQGLHIVPWSKSYKELQLFYLNKYFDRWKAVTSEHLEEWLLETPIEQRTLRKHKHSPISSFAKFLHLKGLISLEEYTKIKMLHPKKSPYHKPKQRIIYDEDIQKILACIDKQPHRYQRALNRTLVIFLAATGLRASEACALTVKDLRFGTEQPYVHVRCGKGGKARKVPFPMYAQQAIQEYLNIRPQNTELQQLFLSFNPKHGFIRMTRKQFSDRFKLISEKTGIEFSAHSFRHYRITKWANDSRISITFAQSWAGHSSATITEQYIHTRDEDALGAAIDEQFLPKNIAI